MLSYSTYIKRLVQNEQLNQQICDANFGDNDFMNQHISKVHDKMKEFKFPESNHSPNAKFLLASFLIIPLVHGGKKSFKCKFCSSFFAQKANLKIHMKSEQDKRNEILSCTTCTKTFMQIDL